MLRRPAFALLAPALLVAVSATGPSPSPPSLEFEVEVVAEELAVPWALAFAPDGRLFVTERLGRIRVIRDGELVEEPWARFRTAAVSEAGLMGIALDPRFAENGFVYVCETYFRNRARLTNRIVRLREEEGRGGERSVLLDRIPGAPIHNGCRLKFGPDGNLYATSGDAAEPDRAQDLESLGGKILRIHPDGSVPADNPFPDSPIWSYGHRNPQGLAFQPGTGRLFATEHGTSTVNELNVIHRGGNYGWPWERRGASRTGLVAPILVHDGPPGGATFITSDRYPGLRGDLFFVTLKTQDVRRVVFRDDGATVERLETYLRGRFGRLRDIVQGPDGYLYVTTSNRDGRGQPKVADDRVLRLRLRGTEVAGVGR